MAPISFLLPLFASILQGAIGHGLAENSRAREQNQLNAQRRARREELQPLINRLRETKDYFDLDEQFTRDFSRASNQLTAQAQSTGMTNAGTGGLDYNRGDLLASGLAQLAQAKQQDESRRQQLLAQLLSDHSLYEDMAQDENVLGATLLGGLLGGVSGGVKNLSEYFSSEAGLKSLTGALGGNNEGDGGSLQDTMDDTGRSATSYLEEWAAKYGKPSNRGGQAPQLAAPRQSTYAPYYSLSWLTP